MSSENAILRKTIAENTGPLVLGFALNWGLCGALCVQVYYYYMAFPKDRILSKSLVFGLFFLEVVQSIIVARDIFGAFVIGYGDFRALADVQLVWLSMPVMTGIISCTVQIFFAFRVYMISGSKIAGVIIIALALMQTAAAFTSGAQMLDIGDLTKLLPRSFVSTTLWLGGNAACDVVIAALMSYFLSRQRTGFKATQILISGIIRLTIETGSMTAAIAIIDLALFLSFPGNNFHSTPTLMLSKLYTISLVTGLNARLRIVNGRNSNPTDIVDSVSNSLRFASSEGDSDGVRTRQRRVLGVGSGRTDGPVVTMNIESEV